MLGMGCDFTGKVVADGDTLTVLVDRRQLEGPPGRNRRAGVRAADHCTRNHVVLQ